MTTKFKTNFKCNGCIAAVKSILEENPKIQKWDVDLQSEDKLLTIEWEKEDSDQIIEKITKAGFKISKK